MSVNDEFNVEREAELQRINNQNTALNENRLQRATVQTRYNAATLDGDAVAADKCMAEMEELDKTFARLNYDLKLMEENRGKSPKLAKLGHAVIEEVRVTMNGLNGQWGDKMAALREHQAAMFNIVAELGLIDRAARKLRAQCENVLQITGINAPWVASPADRVVNTEKQTGAIYMEPRKLTQTFKTGKVIK